MTGSSSSSCCCKSATGAGKNRDPMLYHPLCRIYCSPCNSTVMQSSCDFRNEIRNARFSGKPSSIFCTWNSIQKSLHLLKSTLYFSLKTMKAHFNKSLETKLLLLLQISDISGRFWSSLVKDTIFCFTTSQNRTAQRNDE